MPKVFRHKLVLDENLPTRENFPLLNNRFDLKHIAADYKQSGLLDFKVYRLAKKEGKLLITYNIKDFRELATRSNATGIIGVSPNLALGQIDKKLTSLLTKATKKELLGKFTYISGESKST